MEQLLSETTFPDAADPGSTEIARGSKVKPLQYQGFLKVIRLLLQEIGLPTTDSTGRHLYGTHSFRRGGAQCLAAAGWPVEAIQRLGRWESDAVFLYVRDIIFETTWTTVTTAIRGATLDLPVLTSTTAPVTAPSGTFAARAPLPTDRICTFIRSASKWIDATIVLTPHCAASSAACHGLHTWPHSSHTYVVRCRGWFDDADYLRLVTLDADAKWFFRDTLSTAGDDGEPAPAAATRTVIRTATSDTGSRDMKSALLCPTYVGAPAQQDDVRET